MCLALLSQIMSKLIAHIPITFYYRAYTYRTNWAFSICHRLDRNIQLIQNDIYPQLPTLCSKMNKKLNLSLHQYVLKYHQQHSAVQTEVFSLINNIVKREHLAPSKDVPKTIHIPEIYVKNITNFSILHIKLHESRVSKTVRASLLFLPNHPSQ